MPVSPPPAPRDAAGLTEAAGPLFVSLSDLNVSINEAGGAYILQIRRKKGRKD